MKKSAVLAFLTLFGVSVAEAALSECCTRLEFDLEIGQPVDITSACHSVYPIVTLRWVKLRLVEVHEVASGTYFVVHNDLGCIGPVELGPNLILADGYDSDLGEWSSILTGDQSELYSEVRYSDSNLQFSITKVD